MSVRRASLVCCLALLALVRTANADSARGDTPANGAGRTEDTDELGRSKWWPSPPDRNPGRTSPLANEGTEAKSRTIQPYQRGALFLPYMGMSMPLGSNSGGYTAGHALGVLLGAHLTPGFSLNLEVGIDFMNPGPMATETQTDFALSPLITSWDARHLWVFGFKLGLSSFTRSAVSDSGGAESYSATGFVWGVTLGGFVPVGPMALGCLVRLNFRYVSGGCGENARGTLCNPDTFGNRSQGISPALGTFDIAAAALF